MRSFYTLAVLLLTIPAYAQKYEFGLHGGGSFSTKSKVERSGGSADAGFATGFGVGITLGHNMYNKLGGEVRYTYLRNDLELSSGGQKVMFGAEAHAIHYDFLVHSAGVDAKVRPYVAFGAGIKSVRGNGTENAVQPLANYALLTKTAEYRPLVSFGGGVKFAISRRTMFRIDVHDFFAGVPKSVIAPASGASLSGWIHNIVPTAGISFTF
ncbi:MAG: outer membrane beta-barrel protein [Bryobacteraceae bacterium]|nr:outer membrane beta-barrel protein [Bryobacteraceae bacterium]